jgi:hypothetical protein
MSNVAGAAQRQLAGLHADGHMPPEILMSSNRPDANDAGRRHLVRIQRLWNELKAARKDRLKYEALIERVRREADAFRQRLGTDDRDPKR